MGLVSGGGASAPRWVDLGTINVATFTGRVTLYTTAAREFVAGVRFGDALTLVSAGFAILFELAGYAVQASGGGDVYVDVAGNDEIYDSWGQGIGHGAVAFNSGTTFPLSKTAPPLLAGTLTASVGQTGFQSRVGASATWQANHVYSTVDAIIAAGHFWDTGGVGGTSGGTIPNFAAHFGGSVADGSATWVDGGAAPAVGSVHAYAEIVTV